MKKIEVLGITLVSVALLGGAGTTVLAAEGDTGATTKGTIIFKANDKVTPPVVAPVTPTDPTDPNKEGDKPTGNTEPLRIDIAPNFHFGEFTVGTGVHTASNTRLNSNLQVTDGRGTLAGWTVSVSKTAFTNSGHTLPATFTLTSAEVKNGTNVTAALAGDIKTAVTVDTASQPAFAANADEGGGTYFKNFDGNKATLTFNTDTAKVGEYQSTLTWTLTSATVEGAR